MKKKQHEAGRKKFSVITPNFPVAASAFQKNDKILGEKLPFCLAKVDEGGSVALKRKAIGQSRQGEAQENQEPNCSA